VGRWRGLPTSHCFLQIPRAHHVNNVPALAQGDIDVATDNIRYRVLSHYMSELPMPYESMIMPPPSCRI
jgi:hypothetical protein